MKRITLGSIMLPHPPADENESPKFESAEPLIDEAERHIQEAADRGCHIVCLPETFASLRRNSPPEKTGEEMDGYCMTRLSGIAKKNGIGIVTSLMLTEDGTSYNTGIAIDKKGRLKGAYRKVHLAPGEGDAGVTPGSEFAVMDLNGVKIGIQLCYDLNFPEGARILALSGADIIFWPNMWGGMPESYTDVILRARAIENGLWLVSSAYFLGGKNFYKVPRIFGRTCIVSWDGTILAEVGKKTGLASAEIDLDEKRSLQRDRDTCLFKERRPELYAKICEGAG
ncbi:MAG: carbon-nitrogen hydrolase family protein [Kiritimatiellae bacterium]|nr:carbon-nitrogen hydrolase family protein [Kiritimatiellia bacterium]